MKVFKNCIIRTHNDPSLTRLVGELGVLAGYEPPPSPYSSSLVYGKWDGYGGDNACLHGGWEWNIEHEPTWPRFDAMTEMDKIRAFFSDEPEFDETPLPYAINEELERSTKNKFNLSDDQWGVLPPMARDALAGVEVKADTGVPEWRPINLDDHDMVHSRTVILTDNPREARNDAQRHCRVGFAMVNEFSFVGGGNIHPTHYCPLPTRVKEG